LCLVCLLPLTGLLAQQVRGALGGKRLPTPEPKNEWENFTAVYRIERTSDLRLIIHSFDAGPGGATMTLVHDSGKTIQKLETRAIQGVRFIERWQRPPLIEVHTEGHGTGVKYRELLWYCVDSRKLEQVLNLDEYIYNFDEEGIGVRSGEEHLLQSDSQLRMVRPRSGPYLFVSAPWPVLQVRTTETDWYQETKTNHATRMGKSKVSTIQYAFDPAKREYILAGRRPVQSAHRRIGFA
jgi:hypothetical protein